MVIKLKVNYIRKIFHYNKDIYCIMTKEIENNLTSLNNIQYFLDITYYNVPPNNKKCNLLVLMSYIKNNIH